MTKKQKPKNAQPTHIVYHVQERGGDKKGIWTRIGAMWPHEDGKGFNIQVSLIPTDGRLTIRAAETAGAAQ
ncbi:MAG: hypothetical protein ACK4UZ_01285 [Rhizobium rhizophilum]